MKETPCMYIFMCSQIELSTFVGILQQTSLPYIHSINFIIFQWFIRKFCDFKIVESEDSTRACILTTTYAKIPINKQKKYQEFFMFYQSWKFQEKPFSRFREIVVVMVHYRTNSCLDFKFLRSFPKDSWLSFALMKEQSLLSAGMENPRDLTSARTAWSRVKSTL